MGGTIYDMRKTTVYLPEEDWAALRRAAIATGRSQAELIREGVRMVTDGQRERPFHSMGVGRSSGPPIGDRFEGELGKALEEAFRRQGQ